MSDTTPPPEALPINSQPTTSDDYNRSHILSIQQSELNTLIKTDIYNKARTIKVISLIDLIFLFVNLVISLFLNDVAYFFFLFFPLCLSGYFGAKNYNKYMVYGYLSYLFIMTVIYIAIAFVYSNFFYFILFVIQLYFFTITGNFINCLSKADSESLESLREGWKPNNELIVIHYY